MSMYSVPFGSKATALNTDIEGIAEAWKTMGTPGKGAAIGLAAMAAFIPGMLGSRKTGGELRDIYSGVDPVPVRAGRWWVLGSTPFEGGRIKAWRPHWSILHKSRAEETSLYGSEENKWAHSAILPPLKWLRDPYYLEKLHYKDRPYPVSSPAYQVPPSCPTQKPRAPAPATPLPNQAVPAHMPSPYARRRACNWTPVGPGFPFRDSRRIFLATCRFRPRIAVGVFVMGMLGDPGIFDRVLIVSATFRGDIRDKPTL